MIDQETEQLQRGRIDPVEIFHDKEQGLPGRDAQQNAQQGLQGLLLLLRRRQVQRSISSRKREGEEGSEQGYGLCQRQAILHQEALQLAELLLGGLVALKAQGHALQQVDQRIQGRMLVIRRTLARRQPRLRLSGHMLFQYLHQARFANARLAAQQHHLPETVLDLRPALQEQRRFLLPPHQRGQAGAADGFQATARHTLRQHLIDLQRLGKAFQKRCAE